MPTKRAVGAQALRNGPTPPLEAITYRYRDLGAEEVENYAQSHQGGAETMRELQEAAEEYGRELLIGPGTRAPSAPAHAEPQPRQPRT